MDVELIYRGIEFCLCLFEGYLYYIFWNHFFQERFYEKWKTVLCIGAAETVIFAANSLRIPSINLVVTVLIHMELCLLLYDGTIRKKFFLTAVMWFVAAASEFLVIIFADMTLGSRTIYYTYDAGKACLTTFVIKLITYLIVRLICMVWKNGREEGDVKIPFCFYLSPLASMLLFIGLAYSDIQFMELSADSIFIVFGCLLVFVSNIILLELYNRIMSAMETMQKYDILNKENMLKSDYYKQLEATNEQIHNMTHYLGTIRTLAVQSCNKEIIELVGEWNQTINEIAEEKYSFNPVINAVLNEKKARALSKNVEYFVFVEQGFTVGKVKNVDLVGIFSNLIENALEAAEKCSDGYVSVHLFRANDGRFAVIKVDNNFKETPVVRDGQFVTSKEDKKRHGIGTRYLDKMAKEYHGWCHFSIEGDRFSATMMLPS